MSATVFFLALAIFALIISAVMAMAETALSRIDLIEAKAMTDEKRRGAHALSRLVSSPERFATTINGVLLLALAAQVTWVTATAEVLLLTIEGPIVILCVFLEVLVGYVLTAALPKTLALQNPVRVALITAPFVRTTTRVLPVGFLTKPLIGIANILVPGRGLKQGPFIYEQQMLALAETAEADQAIGNEDRQLIHSVIEFRNTIVREVMVPRTDMISVGEDRSANEALDLAMALGFSRLPVYRDGTDNITGVLFTKDLVKAVRSDAEYEPSVADLRKEAKFVPETKRVAELLREMQNEKMHIAIVVDEFGAVVGLATLEDLIEEVVGDITDEYDEEESPKMESLGADEWLVDARVPLDEINHNLQLHLPEGDWDTLGGLLIDAFERVPLRGDVIDIGEYRFWIEQTSGRRVRRVRVKRISKVDKSMRVEA